MAEKRIEFKHKCRACGGTGLYVGMAERDGFAVVCHDCKGEGERTTVFEYEEADGKRRPRAGVLRVLRVNPGIIVGVNADRGLTLESYGGMPYAEWSKGSPFPPGSEDREHTCPAWWWQSADYKRKPNWDDEHRRCGWGSFSECRHFKEKAGCWERFDREQESKP